MKSKLLQKGKEGGVLLPSNRNRNCLKSKKKKKYGKDQKSGAYEASGRGKKLRSVDKIGVLVDAVFLGPRGRQGGSAVWSGGSTRVKRVGLLGGKVSGFLSRLMGVLVKGRRSTWR